MTRAILAAASACIIVGYLLICRHERKRDATPPRRPSPLRYEMNPDHPDHPYQPGAWLSCTERWEWDAIEARLVEAGLDILDSEEERP